MIDGTIEWESPVMVAATGREPAKDDLPAMWRGKHFSDLSVAELAECAFDLGRDCERQRWGNMQRQNAIKALISTARRFHQGESKS